MEFDDPFKPGSYLPDMQATDRWQAIEELVGHLVLLGKIKAEHRLAVVESVKARERAGCTAVGRGVAVPHAETGLVTDVVGIVARSRMGVDFQAVDQELVKTVLLFLLPKGEFIEHQHVLANLVKGLHKKRD